GRVAVYDFANPGDVTVKNQPFVLVDYINVRTITVKVLAQQGVQAIGLVQVDGTAYQAFVIAFCIKNRVRQKDQQTPGGGQIGWADHGFPGFQCQLRAFPPQCRAKQVELLGSIGQNPALGIQNQNRVKAVVLFFQAS